MSRKHAAPWNSSVTAPVDVSTLLHQQLLWSCAQRVVPARSKASCLVPTPVALILVAVANPLFIISVTLPTLYIGAVGLVGMPSADARAIRPAYLQPSHRLVSGVSIGSSLCLCVCVWVWVVECGIFV